MADRAGGQASGRGRNRSQRKSANGRKAEPRGRQIGAGREAEPLQESPPTGAARATSQPAADELLEMDQAIALLRTSRPTFYRWVRQGLIKGHKLGRQWRFFRQDVERFLTGQAPRIDLQADISPLIKTLHDRVVAAGGSPAVRPDASETRRAASLMVKLATALRASDIHIAPQTRPDGRNASVVRLRIDGVLHEVAEFDLRLLPAVVEQWKQMAGCDVHEKNRPQDGRIMIAMDEPPAGKDLDLRVSFMPTVFGEALTARILDPNAVKLDIEQLGLAPRQKELLLKAIDAPNGLVIIAGPTGCGKTTVMYTCLLRLARPELKVMSIEDPVEYLLAGVVQSQVNDKGLTFAAAVRAMLRSDPDVIMIGEIRDSGTLWAALQAALTGHLIFSTLHTEDAPGTLIRMVEIGADPFVVADATVLVMAQRLVRRVCPDCSVPAKSPQFLERAAVMAREGGLDWDALDKRFREPVGCKKCGGTGYRGRRLIAELLAMSPTIGAALRRRASADELRKIAISEGMRTMAADGIRLAAEGVTSLAEVMRVRGM